MIESYPLYWPDSWKRTAPGNRQHSPFDVTFGKARDHLYKEVEKLGGTKVILSTNVRLNWNGLVSATQKEPADPGVALYFDYKGKPMCFACDKFRYVWENIRSIGLTIASIRAIERYGASDMMERAFRGFTALPEQGVQAWREILKISTPKPTEDEVESAFRTLVKVHHPDAGGNADKFHQLVLARENARKDLNFNR